MKNLLFIIFILIYSNSTSGQKKNAIWCFGDSAGIDFNDTINPTVFTTGMNSRGTCSTICDSAGNLLFYCGSPDIDLFWNGILKGTVYNRNHEKMINGDSLKCETWYHEMVIVPNPDNNHQYYIFHIGVTGQYGLYYSVVDMSMDSGRGAVISKNNQLLSDLAQDCIQTVKHGNGKDWWVIFYSPYNADSFFVYSINSSGVALDHIDSLGIQATSSGGDLRFNSTGTQFAYCNWRGAFALYDFDRCSGRITLNKIIYSESSTYYPYFIDVCFSPNDSLLYVSCAPYFTSFDTSEIYLYQLQLWVPNIYASRILIWNQIYPMTIGAVRLAPDNRIYIATQATGYPYDSTNYYTENMNLSVINQPNNIGAACVFQPYSFYLGGKRNYWGLPNNPDYDLQPLAGSICDTIYTGISENVNHEQLQVFPNPSTGHISVSGFEETGRLMVRIFDSSGRLVLETSTFQKGEIDIRNLLDGLYFIIANDGEQSLRTTFIKMNE